MNEWINERTNEWMNEWMDEWMNGWMNKWMIVFFLFFKKNCSFFILKTNVFILKIYQPETDCIIRY